MNRIIRKKRTYKFDDAVKRARKNHPFTLVDYHAETRIIEVMLCAIGLLAIILLCTTGCESSDGSDPEPMTWDNGQETIVAIMPPSKYSDPEGAIVVFATKSEIYSVMPDTAIQSQWRSCSMHNDDESALIVGNPVEVRPWTAVPDSGRTSIRAAVVRVYNPSCWSIETNTYTYTVEATPTP